MGITAALKGKSLQWAVAAMLLLSAGFGIYRLSQGPPVEATITQQLDAVDAEELDAYVEQHFEDFDAELIEASAAAAPPSSLSAPTLNDQEISQYLMDDGAI